MKERIFAFLAHINRNMWSARDRDDYRVLSPEQRDSLFEDSCVDWEKWDEMIRFLPAQGFNTVMIDLGNGVKFDRHPELAVRSSLSKEFMKQKLDEMRAAGLTPIPKLNFSAGHNPWLCKYSRMVGTDEYYRTCLDCIDEMAELFGYPEYFHLGLDEEVYWGPAYSSVRSQRVFWRDAARLFDRCEHHNMRPWIWADAYWHYPEQFLRCVPKSVLLSNWFYEPFNGKTADGRYKQKGFQAYIDLNEHGYDQVPTGSTWNTEYNLDETMCLATRELDPTLLKGIMTAPWVWTKDEYFYIIKQEAIRFGSAKRKYFTEGGEIIG